MRKRAKRLMSTMLCCLILFIMLASVSSFLMEKSSYEKNADFYGYEGDYEVLFLGTSHMIMGISPMELWNDYGIVSYNLADYGQLLPVNYWVLVNALNETSPRLVVVDVYDIDWESKYSTEHIPEMHEMFDVMPLCSDKVRAVYDLLPKGNRMEFLFPFSLYHTRWSEIDSSFWDAAYHSIEKGANLDCSNYFDYARVYEGVEPQIIDKSQMNMEETVNKEYLRKIIELCQSEEIDILLTALPFPATEEQQKWLNSVQVIADEYQVDYLDFIVEDTCINYSTDMFDSNHLNSSGSRKTTEALGAYIVKHYGLTDWQNSEISSAWDRDYETYAEYKLNWLSGQTELNSYLMLLADKNFNAIIEIYNPAIWSDSLCVHLFENFGIDTDEISENTEVVVIKEGGQDVDVIEGFRHHGSNHDTSIGQLSLFGDEVGEDDTIFGTYRVYLNDEEKYIATLDESVDVGILVLDKDTLEIEDYTTFSIIEK